MGTLALRQPGTQILTNSHDGSNAKTVRFRTDLMQGAVEELQPEEREHKKDRDHCQHQHNAEGDYALLSSFSSVVPWHDLGSVTESESLGHEGGVSIAA